jgi:predicted dehydrogenase
VALGSNIPGMGKKVGWGILSTAGIAIRRVIPAMQKSDRIEVVAIASRDRRKAEEAASALGIPQAYGSYEDLLADPEVEAIYNPLPNQLHVPWSIKAAEAGKHVLCEKPLSVTVTEVKSLLAVQERNQFTIQGEAFSRAVREGTNVPVPLTDAIKNMAVIEAIVRSGQSVGGKRPSLQDR